MPIIKTNQNKKPEKIKLVVNPNLFREVKEYCSWAKVDVDAFFEQAAEFILKKDRDWKAHKKSKAINE